MNLFYKLWSDAESGKNSYNPIDVHWSEIPGRDEKWKQETIANTSQEQFNREFECEFLGSIDTLISASKLRVLSHNPPIQQNKGLDIYEEVNKIIIMLLQLTWLVVISMTTQHLLYLIQHKCHIRLLPNIKTTKLTFSVS